MKLSYCKGGIPRPATAIDGWVWLLQDCKKSNFCAYILIGNRGVAYMHKQPKSNTKVGVVYEE